MKVRYRVLSLLFLLSIITYIDRVCISVAGPGCRRILASRRNGKPAIYRIRVDRFVEETEAESS